MCGRELRANRLLLFAAALRIDGSIKYIVAWNGRNRRNVHFLSDYILPRPYVVLMYVCTV